MGKRLDRKIQAAVSDQFRTLAEGSSRDVTLESLLTGNVISTTVSGLSNSYKTYGSQVEELYKKYNNSADFGCAQVRAVVDMRTAFIAGQGLSISCNNSKTSKWLENYIRKNKFNSIKFFNCVKGSELSGHTILYNKFNLEKNYVEIYRCAYRKEYPNNYLPDTKKINSLRNIRLIRKNTIGVDEEFKISGVNNFIYVPIGGDDLLSYGPTPKLGVVLVDFENYDRALKDMRRLNHVLARITPTIQTKSSQENKEIKQQMQNSKWKIGDAFIGTATFKYEVPGNSAHKNLIDEMVSNLKNISAVSGMPVHWLGYVDLMSNRATADALYEFINNATLTERVIWESSIYDLIIDAQETFIDNGGDSALLDKIDYDFEVKIPLIDYSNFLQRVQALSLAFNDRAISMADYRNDLPGIDPMQTKKMIEEEEKEEMKKLLKQNKIGLRENMNLNKPIEKINSED